MRFLALAALLAAPWLTGCAGSGSYRISADGTNFTPLGRINADEPCRSKARVCVQAPVVVGFMGNVNAIRTRTFMKNFALAAQLPLDSGSCDLGVRFPNTWNDSIEVVDAKNQFVGRIEVGTVGQSAVTLCKALAPGGLFAGKIALNAVAAVASAPAAPTAPASGMSREELSAIVAAAVKQNQAAAPAAAPAPAASPASPTPRFASPERPEDLAVIVGVESYSDITAKAPYAERDADAFKAHVRALGVPERNIVLLKGSKAVKSSLEKNLEAWLPRLAKPDSRVYFYFSGHGAPDIKSGQAYLVPWDGDPNFLESTAYPVSRLYQKLGALPAKQVLVAMDSCFSGAGGRSVLASGARPLVGKIETGAVPSNLTVLAASGVSEISGSLDDRQHGAFTWFLLEGLNAGKTNAKALHAYLTPKVQDEARRLNRDQTPQLLGADLSLR